MLWDVCHNCGDDGAEYSVALKAEGPQLDEFQMPAKVCKDCFETLVFGVSPPPQEQGVERVDDAYEFEEADDAE